MADTNQELAHEISLVRGYLHRMVEGSQIKLLTTITVINMVLLAVIAYELWRH